MTRDHRPERLLVETRHLLIDGNNLLHRVAGSPDPGSIRLLLARLARAVPATVETLVMLDGPPDPGAPGRERVRAGLEVRHAGRVPADDRIVEMVLGRSFAERAAMVVVTDDRALLDRVRTAGGRTARLGELEALLRRPPVDAASALAGGRGSAPAPGRPLTSPTARPTPIARRPTATGPHASPSGDPADDGEGRPAWSPGRGATRKRGNPRKPPRRPPDGRGGERTPPV